MLMSLIFSYLFLWQISKKDSTLSSDLLVLQHLYLQDHLMASQLLLLELLRILLRLLHRISSIMLSCFSLFLLLDTVFGVDSRLLRLEVTKRRWKKVVLSSSRSSSVSSWSGLLDQWSNGSLDSLQVHSYQFYKNPSWVFGRDFACLFYDFSYIDINIIHHTIHSRLWHTIIRI